MYSVGGAKALNDWTHVYTHQVSSMDVADSDFRAIEALFAEGGQFAGQTIKGLKFNNIRTIEGIYTHEESSLTDLVFDEKLERIGENVFHTSYHLKRVVFNNPDGVSVVSEQEISSFPLAGQYLDPAGCAFSVPFSSKDKYKNDLSVFIGDIGYLELFVSIKFDTVTANGSDPAFGTPSLNGEELSNVPVGRTSPTAAGYIPTMDGWVFEGYFTSAENNDAMIFTPAGDMVPSVDGYSNAKASWVKEDESTTVYGHWSKEKYSVEFSSNNGNLGTIDAEVVPNVEFGAELTIGEDDSGNSTISLTNADGEEIVVTATPKEATTKTTFVFDSWRLNGEEISTGAKIGGADEITAQFTSYTNPGFGPVLKEDTIVDIDAGNKRVYLAYSFIYHARVTDISGISPYGDYTSVEGIYTDPVGGVKVIEADGTFVPGIDGYTDETGWACTSSKVTLYVHWN